MKKNYILKQGLDKGMILRGEVHYDNIYGAVIKEAEHGDYKLGKYSESWARGSFEEYLEPIEFKKRFTVKKGYAWVGKGIVIKGYACGDYIHGEVEESNCPSNKVGHYSEAWLRESFKEIKEKLISHPTRERILKAAEASPEVCEALEGLYPDLFEKLVSPEVSQNILKVPNLHYEAAKCLTNKEVQTYFLNVRNFGDLKGKGFFLRRESGKLASWKIVLDNTGSQVLVPE